MAPKRRKPPTRIGGSGVRDFWQAADHNPNIAQNAKSVQETRTRTTPRRELNVNTDRGPFLSLLPIADPDEAAATAWHEAAHALIGACLGAKPWLLRIWRDWNRNDEEFWEGCCFFTCNSDFPSLNHARVVIAGILAEVLFSKATNFSTQRDVHHFGKLVLRIAREYDVEPDFITSHILREITLFLIEHEHVVARLAQTLLDRGILDNYTTIMGLIDNHVLGAAVTACGINEQKSETRKARRQKKCRVTTHLAGNNSKV
jgi:hypothetical protein